MSMGSPPRSFDDAWGWSKEGTGLFIDRLGDLTEDEYSAPSGLSGWSRKHLIAHVAGNADALHNLMYWAATGQETPMYVSPGQRAADIDRGAAMTGAELVAWASSAAQRWQSAAAGLTPQQWAYEVITAQGRAVPAAEVPWLRAREVCVHAIDLDLGITFQDLPTDFLEALCHDVLLKRGPLDDATAAAMQQAPPDQRAAYLTGRRHTLVASDGSPLPDLPPWL
jgi:uncharacterized protein (TIGR03083 family)